MRRWSALRVEVSAPLLFGVGLVWATSGSPLDDEIDDRLEVVDGTAGEPAETGQSERRAAPKGELLVDSFPGAGLIEELEDHVLLAARRAVEAAELAAGGAAETRLGDHHGVGDLAALDVASRALAGDIAVAPRPQPVVADLEGDAQFHAGTAEHRGLPGAGQAEVCGRRRVDPPLEVEVEALAFDHGEDTAVERRRSPQPDGRAAAPGENGALGGGVHPVAGVDRLGAAPHDPHRGTVATLVVAVLD